MATIIFAPLLIWSSKCSLLRRGWLDRGPRMEIYRRAGVPHLWLIEPAPETVEVYELHSQFELVARHPALATVLRRVCSPVSTSPSIRSLQRNLNAAERQGLQRRGARTDSRMDLSGGGGDQIGALFHPWAIPSGVGNSGTTRRRSVLAFGSSAEASVRLGHFVTEACRWESLPPPKISKMAEDVEAD